MFVFLFVVGLVLVVAGAEFLVRGSSRLALALRVPAIVVGLTLVAFGTSAPELVVSVTAALTGSTSMAFANVMGSNIANVALVIGVASVVRPLTVGRALLRREISTCLALQLLVPLLCIDGTLTRTDGALLLASGIGYNVWLLVEAYRDRKDVPRADVPSANWLLELGLVLAGLVGLVAGAQWMVEGATELARVAGLSERFIGMTVLALGTSMPEVATGVVSARRGEDDVAVGNVIGSNILNLALVLGATALLAPIRIEQTGTWLDIGIAALCAAALIPMALRGRVGRLTALALCCGYIAYLSWSFVLA